MTGSPVVNELVSAHPFPLIVVGGGLVKAISAPLDCDICVWSLVKLQQHADMGASERLDRSGGCGYR
jgi:hypothetical protein